MVRIARRLNRVRDRISFPRGAKRVRDKTNRARRRDQLRFEARTVTIGTPSPLDGPRS
jgi:hypothetical protein